MGEEIDDKLTGQTIAVVLAEDVGGSVLYNDNISKCLEAIEW